MNETKIVMPEKEVRISGSDAPLTVGALSWKDGLAFVAKISQTILQQASFIAGVGEKGLASLTAEKIGEVVAGSAELCEWLLTRTVFVNSPTLQHSNTPTPQTLQHSALSGMPVVDVLRLLDAALEVNLSEEVLGLGKSVGGRLAALMPKRPGSATSTRISSATATPAGS